MREKENDRERKKICLYKSYPLFRWGERKERDAKDMDMFIKEKT